MESLRTLPHLTFSREFPCCAEDLIHAESRMQRTNQKQLNLFRRQYLQLVEPPQLRWPVDSALKHRANQCWMFDNMFDGNTLATLPPPRYRLRILKPLVARLEDLMVDPEEDEILDDLVAALAELLTSELPSETDAAQQKAYVTFSFHDNSNSEQRRLQEQTVTLLESRAVISASGTTGLRTWEAALHLGSFLASESGRALTSGQKVLELGAGTGLLSILCAKYLDVQGVVATDGDEAVVDAIKTNNFLNGVDVDSDASKRVLTAALKWGRHIDGSSFSEDYGLGIPDLVLGADVTFDKTVIPALVTTLADFFDLNSSLRVLIAATRRNEQTIQYFLSACERNKFEVQPIDFAMNPECLQQGPFFSTSTPIEVWYISRPMPSRDLFSFP